MFPLTQRIVTDPSCDLVSLATSADTRTYRIAKIRSLGHMTEYTDFNNTSEHLDLAHNLQDNQVLNCSQDIPHSIRIRHFILLEGRINDKVAIVADHRAR